MNVVLPRLKVFWFSKDNPTQHKKKEKEEEVARRDGKTILKSGQEWALPAKNRTSWKGIVAKSSVMPHNLPRLWEL